MSVIQVTPEKLYSEAERLLKYKNQQAAEMTRLRTLIHSLSSQWSGEAHNAFVAEFNAMEYSFRNFSTLLEDYADLMKSSADKLKQTDKNLRNKIRKI